MEADQQFDVLSGVAGSIEVLLNLHACRPSRKTLDLAMRCGDHLVDHAQHMECGIGWLSHTSAKPLTGYSHGAAGISCALLRLADIAETNEYRVAALQAIEYERSTFSPEKENWPSFRDFNDPEQLAARDVGTNYMVAWCHGAPGIGLARLKSLPYVDDPQIHGEISTALRTTLSEGFGMNHSLCHGALGNLDLLLQARKLLGDWAAPQTYQVAAGILHSINRDGPLCGVPSGVETPGLMTGLSGIGYGLLRLAKPKEVPSVLSLEQPARSAV